MSNRTLYVESIDWIRWKPLLVRRTFWALLYFYNRIKHPKGKFTFRLYQYYATLPPFRPDGYSIKDGLCAYIYKDKTLNKWHNRNNAQ